MTKGSTSQFVPPERAHPHRSRPKAVLEIGRRQIERIVDQHLHDSNYTCSPEYRQGVIDALCQRAFGIGLLIRYKRGTAQADAHWAGLEHGWGLSFPARKGDA